MKRLLRITAFLATTLLITGCSTTGSETNPTHSSPTTTSHWGKCAALGGAALGIPGALSSLSTGGVAMVAGALAAGISCAIADQTPRTVHFKFGSYALDMEDRLQLDQVVERMGKSSRIELTGHTCNIGPSQVNQDLSENRARAVKDYLMEKGIVSSRITTRGKGERYPAFSNSNEDTRQKNRRVEMVIFR